MTGLPARLHFAIIIFWAMKTWLAGISMPRSPRATMTPSVSRRISSKLAQPCRFSSLEMILMFLPFSPRHSRISRTSSPRRMNEAKIMSTPLRTPNWRSLRSFSESAGRSTSVPGRLTPFLDERVPLLMASTSMVLPSECFPTT